MLLAHGAAWTLAAPHSHPRTFAFHRLSIVTTGTSLTLHLWDGCNCPRWEWSPGKASKQAAW